MQEMHKLCKGLSKSMKTASATSHRMRKRQHIGVNKWNIGGGRKKGCSEERRAVLKKEGLF